ncbi:oligosaccharide flippase family protein [Empedobacter falsenii]
MIKKILNKIFNSGNERTQKAKKNIIFSLGIKAISVLTYLLLVPVTLNYLNPTEYGIWLTLSSVLMWINTFDIGLGNGLRNKLSEAIANDNWQLGRSYISTAFVTLAIAMTVFYIVFSVINPLINWYAILNIQQVTVPNLVQIINYSALFFCLTFIVKIIGNVYLALQLPAVNNLLVMLGQVFSLLFIYILSLVSNGSLLNIALIYSIAPCIIYVIAIIYTFKYKYKQLAPSVKLFQKEHVVNLFNLGGQFFILQIAGLVLFSTTNLIISNKFGPDKVTNYNIAYRYFSVVPMLFSIVLAPLWSATTDAYFKQDFVWIKSSLKKVNALLAITAVGLVIMVLLAKWIYKLWVGPEISINHTINITMAIYTYVLVSSLSYSSLINGIGKLKVQVINTLFVAVVFLPLTFYLSDLYNVVGIILTLILVNLSGLVLNIIQFYKIINHKANGIWNR